MRQGPQSSSLIASPILIGSVTVLVTVVAVFLSYNANNGLPFVPTYDVHAQVRDAAGLVRGNDVRIGGKRVGLVTAVTAKKDHAGRPYADLSLKLDKTAQPIRTTTILTIRPRSPLGLKYVELQPGRGGRPLPQNGKLAQSQATPVVDLDEVLGTFDQTTRRSLQLAVAGLGNAAAGRGADLNASVTAMPELFKRTRSVAANVADPRTNLDRLVRGVDSTTEQLAAVAPQLGSLVQGSDVTARALASVSPELQQVVSGLPPTESTATRALAVATPVLADARVLLHAARPGTRVLPQTAARLHAALVVGIPVLRRASALSDRLKSTLAAIDDLAADPTTVGALHRLLATLQSALPTLRFVAPSQLVCNYLGLWTRNVDSTISEGDDSGTWFRTLVILNNDEAQARANPSPNLHVNPYGNTDAPGQTPECEVGNEPYVPGQRIGHVPGNQGLKTELTSPPPEVRGK